MSEAREAILGRVRHALADLRSGDRPVVSAPADVGSGDRPVVRGAYRAHGTLLPEERLRLLVQRLEEYGATVEVTADPRGAAAEALAAAGARRVGVALDLPHALRPSGFELVVDEGLDALALDALDAALTTCAAVCAETGTLALDGGPGQGRRALTLMPDLHVCVVEAGDVVETVPELLSVLEPSAREGRPVVLVSGPSATSDIELVRVEGVHGPRRLVVIVATSAP